MTLQNDKQTQLRDLFHRVWQCRQCSQVVPSLVARIPAGYDSRLALMAQAPGESGVRKTGLQWRGPDGRLRRGGFFLEKYLRMVGYSVDPDSQGLPRPYTTNVVHCWPGSAGKRDRAPNGSELVACRQWWQEELRIVRPSVLVLLGEVSSQAVSDACGLRLSFTEFLKQCGVTCHLSGLTVRCFALPHPTAPYRERSAPYRGRGELYDEAFAAIRRALDSPN